MYSSGEFDIYCKPEKFARAFIIYAMIDDKVIDLDRSIKWKNGYYYIIVEGANGKDECIKLKYLLVK